MKNNICGVKGQQGESQDGNVQKEVVSRNESTIKCKVNGKVANELVISAFGGFWLESIYKPTTTIQHSLWLALHDLEILLSLSYSSRYPKNGWKYFSSHSSLTASDSIVSSLNQEVYICTVHINFIDISNRESIPPRKPLCSLFTNALKKKFYLSNFTFKYKNKF